jgi:hypothetical protein
LIKRKETQEEEYSNHSDNEVDNYCYDGIINNNGSTQEYNEKVLNYLKFLKGEENAG